MKKPLKRLRRYWFQARRSRDPAADSLYLASVDAGGKPHVRTVLVKTLDEQGIGFVTNLSGPKVREFRRSKYVEACLHWSYLNLQVRIFGPVKKMPVKTLQDLWYKRPRSAQILYALGIPQSSPIPSYRYLIRKFRALEGKLRKIQKIPLSPSYVGFVIRPASIEFLHYKPSRLSLREFYRRSGKRWQRKIFAP